LQLIRVKLRNEPYPHGSFGFMILEVEPRAIAASQNLNEYHLTYRDHIFHVYMNRFHIDIWCWFGVGSFRCDQYYL